MPHYPYQCTECGHTFDEYRCVDKRDDVAGCPECGAESKRLFPATTQIVVPANWRRGEFINKTAIKAKYGSGPWEELNRPRFGGPPDDV